MIIVGNFTIYLTIHVLQRVTKIHTTFLEGSIVFYTQKGYIMAKISKVRVITTLLKRLDRDYIEYSTLINPHIKHKDIRTGKEFTFSLNRLEKLSLIDTIVNTYVGFSCAEKTKRKLRILLKGSIELPSWFSSRLHIKHDFSVTYVVGQHDTTEFRACREQLLQGE